MIKANALRLVSSDEETTNINTTSLLQLVKNDQNMIIESVKVEDEIPASVSRLALRMLENDGIIKDTINDLRVLYVSKREDFHISLAGRTKSEKDFIVNLLQDMYGIISLFHYTPENDMVHGRIVFSPKAQMFLTGQYLEIAVYERAKSVMSKLSVKYGKAFKVYRNVRVASKEGKLKNEFDLVIEFGGMFYVVEIKSGKNFREFDKYMYIGQEYQIVPDRFLLVDNYLTDEHAETIEYFCSYFVSNLSSGTLEKKLTVMIENDLGGKRV